MSLRKRRIGRRALGVVVGASLVVLGLQLPALAAPVISAISPTSGPEGCVVVITGTGFDQGGTLAVATVNFTGPLGIDDVEAEFHVVSDTEIWTTVPDTALTGAITVTDGNGDSDDSAVFTVTEALATGAEGNCGPTIASFTPTCGTVGTVVTITGTNLLSESGDDLPAPADDPVGGEVRFNPYGTALATHTGAAESPTTLVVNVPATAVDGPIRVTTALNPAAADDSVDSTTAFDVVADAAECPLGGPQHPRSISLTLRKHLVAKGKVTSTEDPPVTECFAGVPVKIQRRKAGSWKTVGSTTTNDEGKYKRRIKDKPGKYRALAPAVTLADDTVCAKARSPRVRHRH